MDNTITKPDIFKEAIINSSIFIEHTKTCKKCISVACAEAKKLYDKQKEISDRARNTEEQLVIEIMEKEVIPEGYYEVLMMFYVSLQETNKALSAKNFVGWEGLEEANFIERLDNGDEYCKWDIARAILTRSLLVPTDEYNLMMNSLDEANKNFLGLRKYIESEDEYRKHVKACDKAAGQGCEVCTELFQDAELVRITVLESIGNSILWDRYVGLEDYVKGKITDEKLPTSLESVIEKLKEDKVVDKTNIIPISQQAANNSAGNLVDEGIANSRREIDQFLSDYEALLEQNERLEQEIETLKDSKLDNSVFTDEEMKKEFLALKESNKALRERNNKLLEACKAYSEFSLTSRDLIFQYVMLGVSEVALKYNEQLKDVSQYLLYHMTE